jgi:hypothetical protein
MSLLSQVARSAGLDRNPIRRPSDRAEAILRIVGFVTLTVIAPLLAWLVGRDTYQDGVRVERQERALRQHVTATLLQRADASQPPAANPTVLVSASWTLPDGVTRAGWVAVKAGTTAGATVPVWVDTSGLPTTAPRPHDETVAQTAATVALVPLVVAVGVFATQLLVRLLLDRYRIRQWQAGWSQIEPLWTGRPD